MGIVGRATKPDFETRVSILKNKLYRDGIEMNEEVIHYVVKNIKK